MRKLLGLRDYMLCRAAAAAYDDWVRARAHWDYFYHRS